MQVVLLVQGVGGAPRARKPMQAHSCIAFAMLAHLCTVSQSQDEMFPLLCLVYILSMALGSCLGVVGGPPTPPDPPYIFAIYIRRTYAIINSQIYKYTQKGSPKVAYDLSLD